MKGEWEVGPGTSLVMKAPFLRPGKLGGAVVQGDLIVPTSKGPGPAEKKWPCPGCVAESPHSKVARQC